MGSYLGENWDDQFRVVDIEYVQHMVSECEADRAAGKYLEYTTEGDRLAANFRQMFPNVSDHDLATLTVIMARAFGVICTTPATELSRALQTMVASYTYCSATMFKSVLEIKDL